MEEVNPEKEGMKEAKKYTSLSTRLPLVDAAFYLTFCERLGTNASERIRQLVMHDMKKPQRQALAGINKIKYNKVHNSFDWFVQLDSGTEVEVLSNLSLDFLKNFQGQIQEAIEERNEWIHQSKPGSVDVPGELVGGGEE